MIAVKDSAAVSANDELKDWDAHDALDWKFVVTPIDAVAANAAYDAEIDTNDDEPYDDVAETEEETVNDDVAVVVANDALVAVVAVIAVIAFWIVPLFVPE